MDSSKLQTGLTANDWKYFRIRRELVEWHKAHKPQTKPEDSVAINRTFLTLKVRKALCNGSGEIIHSSTVSTWIKKLLADEMIFFCDEVYLKDEKKGLYKFINTMQNKKNSLYLIDIKALELANFETLLKQKDPTKEYRKFLLEKIASFSKAESTTSQKLEVSDSNANI
jgi:hypothetical protein